METYTKINTLYKRNPDNGHIIIGDYSLPEFSYLRDVIWECTEKIDGTNIKICWDGYKLTFEGKTENANIPKHLLAKLNTLFSTEKMQEVFPIKLDEEGNEIPMSIILYGEGYGYKIQQGHNYISDDVNFILFDIKIGHWWLQRESYVEIAKQLNIEVVPLIGTMDINDAEEIVIHGFKSKISQNKDYTAEGLVCKPLYGILDRAGRRIITKLKTCDYLKLNLKL